MSLARGGWVRVPLAGLAWLGGQGTRAIAALVFLGIALPSLGSLCRPWVTEAIFLLLCLAFMRVDPADLKGHLKRPWLVLGAAAWTMLAMPLCFGLACLAWGLELDSPDLFLALMLQAVASPMMASPAFAALMGLDATLVLVTLVASTVLTPFSAPLFVSWFMGPGQALFPWALGLKSFAILAGSALAGVLLRRLLGPAALERRAREISGLNILLVFVFVAAVMEKVAAQWAAAPRAMLGLTGLAFVVFLAVLGLTMLVMARAGWSRALALGLMAAQRNLGLMLAATGGALPELVWLYFALAQFPIYLSPQLLRPLARRLGGASHGDGEGLK